jgi:hypothetical protein
MTGMPADQEGPAAKIQKTHPLSSDLGPVLGIIARHILVPDHRNFHRVTVQFMLLDGNFTQQQLSDYYDAWQSGAVVTINATVKVFTLTEQSTNPDTSYVREQVIRLAKTIPHYNIVTRRDYVCLTLALASYADENFCSSLRFLTALRW